MAVCSTGCMTHLPSHVAFSLGGLDSIVFEPSHGVFGRFDLAALLRLPHLACLFVYPHCPKHTILFPQPKDT